MLELKPISASRVRTWRERYRAQLKIPVIPDFHEALCQMGQVYLIEEVGHTLGYVIMAEETFRPGWTKVIPEFFLELTQTKFTRPVLQQVFHKLQATTVIGRTDDPSGFPVLLDLRVPNQIAASLYLLEREPLWTEDPDLTLMESSMQDVARLLPLYASVPSESGGIPDEVSLTKSLAAWRHYRLVKDGEVLAACYVAPQNPPYVTPTSIVREDQRRKGYGHYLATFASKRELSEGKVILLETQRDNEAARGLVESMGSRLAAHIIHFRP